ncbi:MAG: diguanylate cyclase, partial [Croceibacterium sp.]
MALALLTIPGVAGAAERNLRSAFEVSRAAGTAGQPTTWTWLTLRNPAPLEALPAGWIMQIDQVRFHTLAIVAVARDGSVERTVLRDDQLGDNWAAGGVLEFNMKTPGRDLAQLKLGFERLDSVDLLRKVSVLTSRDADRVDDRWLALMGVFAGLLASAFVYNLIVFTGQRYPFQRWYLAWVATALAYGLIWTNLAAFVLPGLAGPRAVRIDSVLVGLMVALGSQFFLGVIEEGKVPRLMRNLVQAGGVACFAAGVLAANETWLDAQATDRVLNVLLAACVVVSLLAVVLAAVRGSRVVWPYLIGWAPVIAVFAARAARNFGLMGQSDAIDMATFAAMAFESLVFSLLIAGRFMSLRRQRDSAAASARAMEIERETLRRAAHADFLTGLGNRAHFQERMRVLLERGEPFSLFLLDVDFLKELNDRHGHYAGDALLQHIGTALGEFDNQRTSCARIGGDEFAILLEGAPDDVAAMVNRIDALQGMVWARESWSGILSLSIGAAEAEGSLSEADLFQRADIALYEAKKQG